MTRIALVDVDGTLVDTNYQHALAWYRAFRRVGLVPPLWRIHRHIGMGGDQLVPAVAGADAEARHGDLLRDAWAEEFAPFLDEIAPVEGAHDLLARLHGAGVRVALASSGKPEHVERFLDLVDGRAVADVWTTSEDVNRTKPAPELLEVALDKLSQAGASDARAGDVVVVGDSIWDCEAAKRLGARSLATRTGGFAPDELLRAGAEEVFDSLRDLGDALTACCE